MDSYHAGRIWITGFEKMALWRKLPHVAYHFLRQRPISISGEGFRLEITDSRGKIIHDLLCHFTNLKEYNQLAPLADESELYLFYFEGTPKEDSLECIETPTLVDKCIRDIR